MTAPVNPFASPDLTPDALNAIAASLGTDLLQPFMPPARPFTIGSRATVGIRHDYRAHEKCAASAPRLVPGVQRIAERVAHALRASGVIDISAMMLDLRDDVLPVDPDSVRDAVLLCADVLPRSETPTHLLEYLRQLLDFAAVAVVATPLRPLTFAPDDLGPPREQQFARLWTFPELQAGLDAFGLEPLFGGVLPLLPEADDPAHPSPDIGVIIVTTRTATARSRRIR